MGASRRHTFRFEALRAGTTTLALRKARELGARPRRRGIRRATRHHRALNRPRYPRERTARPTFEGKTVRPTFGRRARPRGQLAPSVAASLRAQEQRGRAAPAVAAAMFEASSAKRSATSLIGDNDEKSGVGRHEYERLSLPSRRHSGSSLSVDQFGSRCARLAFDGLWPTSDDTTMRQHFRVHGPFREISRPPEPARAATSQMRKHRLRCRSVSEGGHKPLSTRDSWEAWLIAA